jgi:hypothetical protein
MAILEPGAVREQPPEAALAEQILPAAQIIAAHLIEDEENDEPGPLRCGPGTSRAVQQEDNS